MKKNMMLALIIGIASVIIIGVGLTGTLYSANTQPQPNEEISVPSEPEGKSFTLKLDDSVSTTSP